MGLGRPATGGKVIGSTPIFSTTDIKRSVPLAAGFYRPGAGAGPDGSLTYWEQENTRKAMAVPLGARPDIESNSFKSKKVQQANQGRMGNA